ncbi:molybdenum cofactor biosynthesis protein [Petrotoga mexicana DSM 14811]|uniref:Molybdopterin molybdenumtransferase n=1 Tax=Petrotoga mexicana DSM 14811 TaxID=1122954 RepID=A0A2K1PEG4_9BACT|nr:gephyrin-like molybdotransferase Glp [Petrotoga mexicana]PNS01183.1 molybdenum cofactor biosynthesis protein [Petrotoga mexicana DSM 14811]
MSEFLDLNTPEMFWEIVDKSLNKGSLPSETINFKESNGRILAEDLFSPIDLPPFSRSTVDGFAVKAEDTFGASESMPIYLNVKGEVFMGQETKVRVEVGEAVKIPTGGMLPEGSNAVVMVEYVDYVGEKMIEINRSVGVGENVVYKGEDIPKGKVLLNKYHKIRPQDVGALAGLGITDVEVYKKPKVAVIATGDELVSPESVPGVSEIRDINSYTIGTTLEEVGAEIRYVGIIPDKFDFLRENIKNNLDCDLILISGGSSVGVKDMTVEVLNSLGEPGVLSQGITIKPGKPTIFAVVEGKPILGLPGHPSSSFIITQVIVKPLVEKIMGIKEKSIKCNIKAKLSRNLDSDKGREEYIPVRLIETAEKNHIAEPIVGESAMISKFVYADGYIKIDANKEGLNKEETVDVYLY